MLTARIEDADKILGLELGADDYITKPFNPRGAGPGASAPSSPPVAHHGAAICQSGRVCCGWTAPRSDRGRRTRRLDPHRVQPAEALMQSPGAVFTRAELVEKALGYNYDGIDRTLDTHIKNLRQKLGDDPKHPTYIHTVYGVGYRMAESV
ncbi:MAG: response regulator transcription factor [Caldilineaceae bacterium]